MGTDARCARRRAGAGIVARATIDCAASGNVLPSGCALITAGAPHPLPVHDWCGYPWLPLAACATHGSGMPEAASSRYFPECTPHPSRSPLTPGEVPTDHRTRGRKWSVGHPRRAPAGLHTHCPLRRTSIHHRHPQGVLPDRLATVHGGMRVLPPVLQLAVGCPAPASCLPRLLPLRPPPLALRHQPGMRTCRPQGVAC